MDRVAVRIIKENRTVQLSRNVAEQWAKRQPKEYEIVAPPRIEVTKLQPINVEQVQKKSVAVAPSELKAEVKVEKKKQGRPKKSV